MWREAFSRAIVPIVLTVLGAILYQSGKYSFVDYFGEYDQFNDELQAMEDKLDQDKTEQKAFGEIGKGFREKFHLRRKFFEFVSRRGLYQAATADETHSIALESLAQISEELGQISGYSGLYFHGYRDAVINELTAEANVWEIIRKHTSPNRNRQEDKGADEEYFLATLQLSKASRSAMVVLEQGVNLSASEERQSKRQMDKLRQRLRRFRVWTLLAGTAFFASALAYWMLLKNLVFSVEKEKMHTPNFE